MKFFSFLRNVFGGVSLAELAQANPYTGDDGINGLIIIVVIAVIAIIVLFALNKNGKKN